jgi:hypothetical protein
MFPAVQRRQKAEAHRFRRARDAADTDHSCRGGSIMVETGEQISRYLLQSGPMLVVYLAGIVACIVCWGRTPRSAATALVGLLILLVGHLVGSAATMWVIHRANRDGNAGDIGTMMASLAILRSLGYAVGMAVLLVAVFIDRAPRRFSDDASSPAS